MRELLCQDALEDMDPNKLDRLYDKLFTILIKGKETNKFCVANFETVIIARQFQENFPDPVEGYTDDPEYDW